MIKHKYEATTTHQIQSPISESGQLDNPNTPQKKLKKKLQSGQKVVFAITLLLCSRITYFSTTFMKNKDGEDYICMYETLQNLPIYLIYFCFIVVQ